MQLRCAEVQLRCAGGAVGVRWRCSGISVYFQCIHPVAFQCNSSVVSVYPIQWLFSVIPVYPIQWLFSVIPV